MDWGRIIQRADSALEAGRPGRSMVIDPSERLPEPARAKLLSLRDARNDLRVMSLAVADQMAELRQEMHLQEMHLRRMKEPAGEGGFSLRSDDPQFIAQQQTVDRLGAEIARVQANYDSRTDRWRTSNQIVENVEQWLARVPVGAKIIPHPCDPPKLRKGEAATDAIERIRQLRLDLLSNLDQVRAAPIPAEAAKGHARHQIEALAARGVPDVFGLVERGDQIVWPSSVTLVSSVPLPDQLPIVSSVKKPDALAVLAWLMKDGLLEAVEAEIDARSDDAAALSDDERMKREAELLSAVLETERGEAVLVERSGGEHRPDIDPRALLSVKVEG